MSDEEDASKKLNDTKLREYTNEEIEQFLKDDELTGEAAEIARKIRERMDSLEFGGNV